ncbi:MAG: hypothetical protein Q9Q40_15105 [Acidobacteriota bacterium]|nr:hypothetical protein [Acidobacteriota bacterium]MDQ7086490.1 hypothetical protein [Acidobacteriota bacterium]
MDCSNNFIPGNGEQWKDDDPRWAILDECILEAGLQRSDCVDCVEDPECSGGGDQANSVDLNGGAPMIVAFPFGSPSSSRFLFNIHTEPGEEGQYTLHVAHGLPDRSDGTPGIERTTGTVSINGVVVVDTSVLNASSQDLAIGVQLGQGNNTIEFVLNQAQNDPAPRSFLSAMLIQD